VNAREQRIRAGVKVIEDWIKADARGYIKADDHEVVSRILDATAEPWCNHDAIAVSDGVCECGHVVAPAVNVDDVVDSLRLALSAHPIAPDIAESVIATLVDALDNNL
jgi:hypothetical protein